MIPLFPAAYFIHGPIMDAALTIALTLHIHWFVLIIFIDNSDLYRLNCFEKILQFLYFSGAFKE